MEYSLLPTLYHGVQGKFISFHNNGGNSSNVITRTLAFVVALLRNKHL
jgi:hypothetical protein